MFFSLLLGPEIWACPQVETTLDLVSGLDKLFMVLKKPSENT